MASNPPKFNHRIFPHIYTASAPGKQKCVPIARKDSVAFTLQEIHSNPEGRYLIMVGNINIKTFTITNLYPPNAHQLRFVRKLFCKINAVRKGALIMCGDYNISVDYKIDTTSKSKHLLPILQSLLHAEDVFDVWRCPLSSEITLSTPPDISHICTST